MTNAIQPFHLLVIALAGWLNRQQQAVIDYLIGHGMEPAPEREKRTSWKTFLKAHWDVMAATDFFTVEVWTPRVRGGYP